MATNIPPHNLREVIDGVIWLIENDADGAPPDAPNASREQKLRKLHRGSFPVRTSRPAASSSAAAASTRPTSPAAARIQVRAKAEIETTKKGDRQQIVVTEIPYQVNKAKLLERIADLVRDKTLEGISDIRDESDRDGMRVVIELKRGEIGEVVLNNLYKHTQLQQTFGIIMLAIVGWPAAGADAARSASSTSSSSAARSCGGASSSSCARPKRARTSSRACASRSINLDAVITLIRALEESAGSQGRV